MEKLTLSTLPAEAIQRFIDIATDFGSIISLYNSNSTAVKLLGCKSVVIDPTNDVLFAEARICNMTPYQINLLGKLNERFRLGALSPLSFAKLTRAYNRSALNPTCNTFIPLVKCMKSAAKLGRIEELLPGDGSTLHDKWMEQQRQVDTLQLKHSDKYQPGVKGDWYWENILKLITIAYKHNHLIQANKLWSLIQDVDFSKRSYELFAAVFTMVKAWLKFLLQPYKIKRSRDIRQESYVTLYDPNISDKDKAIIWRQQYQIQRDADNLPILPTAETYEDVLPLGAVEMIDAAMGFKFGVSLDENPPGYAYRIYERIRAIFSVYSGDLDFIEEVRLFGESSYDYDVPIMAKRGYFEALRLREGADFDWSQILIGGWSKHLSDFLGTFSLDEMSACTMGLSQKFSKPRDYLPRQVLTVIVQGHRPDLYEEYVSKFGQPDLSLVSMSLRYTKSKLKDLPMLNKLFVVLSSALPHWLSSEYYSFPQRMATINWLKNNERLYVKIWNGYGRQQFEDTMIFLRPFLDLEENLSTSVWTHIRSKADYDSLGLLAYIYGYKLLPDSKLQRLHEPGITLFKGSYFSANVFRELDYGNFDTALLMHTINRSAL